MRRRDISGYRITLLTGLLLLLTHVYCAEDSGIPVIVEEPEDTYVRVGDAAILSCEVRGEPTPKVTWFRDGREMALSPGDPDDGSNATVLVTGQYFVSTTSEAHEGVYHCTASNGHGLATSRNASITIGVSPEFRVVPHDVTVTEGTKFELKCQVYGVPQPLVIWRRVGNLISRSRTRITDGNGLEISHVTRLDAGQYVCQAENPFGSVETTVKVAVEDSTAPVFIIRPEEETADLGTTVQLSCQALGKPRPTVYWHQDGLRSTVYENSRQGRYEVTESGSLIISSVEEGDAGTWHCNAVNIDGMVTASARLQVSATKPRFLIKPENQTVIRGNSAKFDCDASGTPKPKMVWNKLNTPVVMLPGQTYGRFSVSLEGTLSVAHARDEDMGVYVCQVSQSATSMPELITMATLKVKTPSMTDIRHMLSERIVEVRTAYVLSSTAIRIEWDVRDYDEYIEGFLLKYRILPNTLKLVAPPREEEYYSVALSSGARQYYLSHLKPEHWYEVEVEPYYEDINGKPSQPYRVFLHKDISPAPIIIQGPQNQTLPTNSIGYLPCQPLGLANSAVSWLKDNDVITDQKISISESGSLRIPDLELSDSGWYSCVVRSGTGQSSWSARLEVKPYSDPKVIFHRTPSSRTFPSSPGKPRIDDVTDGSVKLSWQPGAEEGASPLIGYLVEMYSPDMAGSWTLAKRNLMKPTALIESLSPETQYMFMVRAENSHGIGPPSHVTEIVKTRAILEPRRSTPRAPTSVKRRRRAVDSHGLPNPRITEHPENQFVAKNDPATLNCKAEGEPEPQIVWYRNGRPVVTARDNPTSHRTMVNNGQLFFYRIIHNKKDKPDIGTYYCNATNIHGSAISRNATLEIALMRDEFRGVPQNERVAIGETVVLRCRPPKGQPEPRVKWKKDGQIVHESARIRIQESGNLIITDAKDSDNGNYVCVAHSIAGEKMSPRASLAVLEKPKFLRTPEDLLVTENEDVRFQCRAAGDPNPVIVWHKEDGQIPSQRSRITDDKSLKISKVKVSDEGTYVCKAENDVGVVMASGRLTVHSHPSFITTPVDRVIGVGRTVTLKCEVSGNPPPAVFWNREDSQTLMFPRQDHGRFSVTDEGTLIIERAQKSDSGEYVCQALSVAGSAFAKARVDVEDVDPRPPPIIFQGPQNQTLPLNSIAVLICESSGDPKPTISWFRGREQIRQQPAGRVTVLSGGSLQISDLQFADTAIYTCKASSETGVTTWSAKLTVETPSKNSVIFHRTPEPSTFPGAPTKPIITDVDESSVKLMWTPNMNQGASPVFAYTVEYFSHETGQGWVVASQSVEREEFTVKDLRKDTSYMFLVRARNSHGMSLPSPVSDTVRTGGDDTARPTLVQFDIPLVEEKLSGNVVQMREPEVISSSVVRIHWNVLKSYKYIEGFHIKYRPMPLTLSHHHHHHHHVEYSIETVTSARATMYILRNLKKYTWYEIRIQPFYLSVEGQLSNAVRMQTFEDVPSAAPLDIKAEKGKNNTIQLSWKEVDEDQRNGNIKGYKIYVIGNSTRFNRNYTTNATAFLVPNIVDDMQYKIYLAAYTRMGIGLKSAAHVIGGLDDANYAKNIMHKPWFFPTVIGIVAAVLWLLLCVGAVWYYRRGRSRKPYFKAKSGNPVLNLTVNKPEEVARLNGYASGGYYPHSKDGDGCSSVTRSQPDILEKQRQQQLEYNTMDVTQMKTFYNKNNAIPLPVAPYATTMLCGHNTTVGEYADPNASAFRPVNKPMNDLVKPDFNSNESNSDNGLLNSGLDNMPPYFGVPPECIGGTTSNDSDNYTIDQDGLPVKRPMPHPKQHPVLNFADFIPPPPDQPPPSDIGTPPDSPTQPRKLSLQHSQPNTPLQPPLQPSRTGTTSYRSPHDRLPTPPRNLPLEDRRSVSPKHDERRTQTPKSDMNRMHSPRSNSPRQQQQQQQQQQHEPPFKGGFKVLPTEGEFYRPLPMPPSPGYTNPLMDRAIQSSLPSVAGDTQSPVVPARLECTATGPQLSVDLGYSQAHPGQDSPVSEVEAVQGDYPGSMVASWTDNSNSDVTSARSSLASSSDGSFLTEADFATAVAKAAELSGLTVVGSTVSGEPHHHHHHHHGNGHHQDANKKKYHKHRERAKRPTSPYSTDSNYSAIPPHKPYPKSQRKKQLQEQAQRYPPRSKDDSSLHQPQQAQQQQQRALPPAPPERANSLNKPANQPSSLPHNAVDFPFNRPVPQFSMFGGNSTTPRNYGSRNKNKPHRHQSDASDHNMPMNAPFSYEQPPPVV